MGLLRIITLVYAGVLVAALAASLVVIVAYLRRIGRKLGDVRASLELVQQQSAPLESYFSAVDEEAARIEKAALEIGSNMASAIGTLQSVLGLTEENAES